MRNPFTRFGRFMTREFGHFTVGAIGGGVISGAILGGVTLATGGVGTASIVIASGITGLFALKGLSMDVGAAILKNDYQLNGFRLVGDEDNIYSVDSMQKRMAALTHKFNYAATVSDRCRRKIAKNILDVVPALEKVNISKGGELQNPDNFFFTRTYRDWNNKEVIDRFFVGEAKKFLRK